MGIVKAKIKDCEETQATRFAPYAGAIIFIIDNNQIIIGEELEEGFDVDFYKSIFEIIQEWD